MNPLTATIFDVNTSRVEFNLLDMCCTQGVKSATAECIFNKTDEKMVLHDIPWQNCFGFGVDNTSVNLGKRNSIKTRVEQQVGYVYFMGCQCHIVHNVASDSFQSIVHFDVEDFAVDMFYWFDKSTNKKAAFSDFCTFCDVEYKAVVKQVNTRLPILRRRCHGTSRSSNEARAISSPVLRANQLSRD